MKTLKIIGLSVLLVGSFVYGQQEVDETKGKDVKSIGVDAQQVEKSNNPKPCCTTDKPKQEKMSSHETGKKSVDKTEAIKSQKGSFWKRVFGGKGKKEENN
jgi:hypothetical protein|tara:strand:- start:20 stop:322 length:303 start_codon:yes stop_codon:yes gene_type:complete